MGEGLLGAESKHSTAGWQGREQLAEMLFLLPAAGLRGRAAAEGNLGRVSLLLLLNAQQGAPAQDTAQSSSTCTRSGGASRSVEVLTVL